MDLKATKKLLHEFPQQGVATIRKTELRALVAEVERLKGELAKYVDPQSGIQYLHASEDEHYRRGRLIGDLRAEVKRLKTGGIIEVAVENPNVQHYMEHWEGRAEKAEAKIEAALRVIREWPGLVERDDVLIKALRDGRKK